MHTVERLKKFAPKADPALLVAIVKGDAAAKAAGINTPLRLQHFLAQIAHESGGFKSLTENMNYSSSRLVEVFGTRNGLTRQKATALAKQGPEAIANFVYGLAWGKKNLGNTEPNDGWDFRGGGFMQTTGRANYTARGKATGFDLANHPELLRDPATAFAVACKEWEVRGCNAAADKDDLRGVTKKINGGTNGLEDREAWLARAKEVFPPASTEPLPIVATYPDGAGIPLPGGETVNAPSPDAGWFVFGPDALTKKGDDDLRTLQQYLLDLGYKSVKTADGMWGPATIGTLAEFRAFNELPDVQADLDKPRIDVWTRTALMMRNAKRWVPSEERANANEATFIRKAPQIATPAVAGQKIGQIGSAAVPIGGAVVGTASYLGKSWEMLSVLKDFITSPITLAVIIAVLAFALWAVGSGVLSGGRKAVVDGGVN